MAKLGQRCWIWLSLVSVLVAVACSNDSAGANASGVGSESTISPTGSTVATSPAGTPTTTTNPAEDGREVPALDHIDWEITWDSIGPVRVGSSLQEIEAAVGPGFDIIDAGPLGEALSGYAVALDDEVLLHVATYNADDPRFELLFTDNPRLALSSGLRPGMTLGEAVELHGKPRLSFHTANHGREYAVFADGIGDLAETISIETTGVDALQAGLYGDLDPKEELFETTDYDPEGTIATLRVTCFGAGRQSCAPRS